MRSSSQSLTIMCIAAAVMLWGCKDSSHSKSPISPLPQEAPPTITDQLEREAGDWNSGGGYALTDAENPWFLENTPEAYYCVLIDEKNFGQSLEASRNFIARAFDYWKKQFTSTETIKNENYDGLAIEVATQKFTEVPCSDPRVDIRFQLGVLDEKQKAKMGDFKQYYGVTVRTHYDRKSLRSKGFVYIAPQYGSLARKDHAKHQENLWNLEDGRLLHVLLTHEIGHIFGTTHSPHPIMRTSLLFPWFHGNIQQIAKFYDPEPVTHLSDGSYMKCSSDEFGVFNFERNPLAADLLNPNCIRMTIQNIQSVGSGHSSLTTKVELLSATSPEGPYHSLGSFDGSRGRGSTKPLVTVVLQKGQEVFPSIREFAILEAEEITLSSQVVGFFNPVGDQAQRLYMEIEWDLEDSTFKIGGEIAPGIQDSERDYDSAYISIRAYREGSVESMH